MNTFFRNLRVHTNGNITETEFQQFLEDEEYINNSKVNICYFCDNESFDILEGGKDCYDYIGNRMYKMVVNYENDIEQTHHLGLLCNWLNKKGVPIFADAEKHPELNLIICKSCGRILGVKLDEWYFPYLGYMDDVNIIRKNELDNKILDDIKIINIFKS